MRILFCAGSPASRSHGAHGRTRRSVGGHVPVNVASLRPIVEATLRECGLPGAVVAVARGDEPVAYTVVGTDAEGRPLAENSLFPVASITKLATALCVLRLVDDGVLALDDPLAAYLPRAKAAQPGVTLRRLLTHTSGLPFDIAADSAPPWEHRTWDDFVSAWLATPLEAEPGTCVGYSNVGYALLGLVVGRVCAKAFKHVVRSRVLAPLEIEAYLGEEPPRPAAAVVDALGPGTATAWWNTAYWRSFPLPYVALVTTAAGAIGFARAFAPPFLAAETAAEATSDQTGGLSGHFADRSWGPLPWGLGPPIGRLLPGSSRSFGHGGVTSCVVWVDPEADISVAALGTLVGLDWLNRGVPQIAAALGSQTAEATRL
jgi:CubicO group peptidase (beta-lactamase class C family)